MNTAWFKMHVSPLILTTYLGHQNVVLFTTAQSNCQQTHWIGAPLNGVKVLTPLQPLLFLPLRYENVKPSYSISIKQWRLPVQGLRSMTARLVVTTKWFCFQGCYDFLT